MANEKVFPKLSETSLTSIASIALKNDEVFKSAVEFGIEPDSGFSEAATRADHTHGTPVLNTPNTITLSEGVLQLKGDEEIPANLHYYGTDDAGNIGYHLLELPDEGILINRIVLGDFGSGLESVTDEEGNWLYGKFDALELEY